MNYIWLTYTIVAVLTLAATVKFPRLRWWSKPEDNPLAMVNAVFWPVVLVSLTCAHFWVHEDTGATTEDEPGGEYR